MRPLKILHTEWSDGWGGQERRILLECEGLMARGHQVEIATRESCWTAKEARSRGIPTAFFPMARKLDFVSIRQLRAHLRQGRFDVVHTHSGIDAWIGGIAAKWAGTPALVRTRHLFMPFHRSPLNFVHYLPDRLFCLGDTMRTMLVDECGFPDREVVNIPTGIDFGQFRPSRNRSEVRAELGVGDDEFLVLVVGVLRGVKRHDIAIDGFARFLKAGGRGRLVLAGDGPMRSNMEELVRSLGIEDQARLLGHRTDVPDLMGAADTLLLTSRSEAQSQALTQGIGLGIPAVATAVGGVPEVVVHERTGLLVPPGDPDAVAIALHRLADNPTLRRQLGDAGREHANRRYSLAAMLDATEAAYRTVLEEKGRW
jgi:glycosyltransferase involved in cell wall biosynthesis